MQKRSKNKGSWYSLSLVLASVLAGPCVAEEAPLFGAFVDTGSSGQDQAPAAGTPAWEANALKTLISSYNSISTGLSSALTNFNSASSAVDKAMGSLEGIISSANSTGDAAFKSAETAVSGAQSAVDGVVNAVSGVAGYLKTATDNNVEHPTQEQLSAAQKAAQDAANALGDATSANTATSSAISAASSAVGPKSAVSGILQSAESAATSIQQDLASATSANTTATTALGDLSSAITTAENAIKVDQSALGAVPASSSNKAEATSLDNALTGLLGDLSSAATAIGTPAVAANPNATPPVKAQDATGAFENLGTATTQLGAASSTIGTPAVAADAQKHIEAKAATGVFKDLGTASTQLGTAATQLGTAATKYTAANKSLGEAQSAATAAADALKTATPSSSSSSSSGNSGNSGNSGGSSSSSSNSGDSGSQNVRLDQADLGQTPSSPAPTPPTAAQSLKTATDSFNTANTALGEANTAAKAATTALGKANTAADKALDGLQSALGAASPAGPNGNPPAFPASEATGAYNALQSVIKALSTAQADINQFEQGLSTLTAPSGPAANSTPEEGAQYWLNYLVTGDGNAVSKSNPAVASNTIGTPTNRADAMQAYLADVAKAGASYQATMLNSVSHLSTQQAVAGLIQGFDSYYTTNLAPLITQSAPAASSAVLPAAPTPYAPGLSASAALSNAVSSFMQLANNAKTNLGTMAASLNSLIAAAQNLRADLLNALATGTASADQKQGVASTITQLSNTLAYLDATKTKLASYMQEHPSYKLSEAQRVRIANALFPSKRTTSQNGNMYGVDVQIGYKQFFGHTRRWGLRYYATFSYQHGTFNLGDASAVDNFTYGAGIDALYNFYESKDGKYTSGVFAGLMLTGSTWNAKGASQYQALMAAMKAGGGRAFMHTTYFQIPLNIGFRTNVSRHHGFEIGLRIPLAVDYYFKGSLVNGLSESVAYKRNVSVFFNYVYNF